MDYGMDYQLRLPERLEEQEFAAWWALPRFSKFHGCDVEEAAFGTGRNPFTMLALLRYHSGDRTGAAALENACAEYFADGREQSLGGAFIRNVLRPELHAAQSYMIKRTIQALAAGRCGISGAGYFAPTSYSHRLFVNEYHGNVAHALSGLVSQIVAEEQMLCEREELRDVISEEWNFYLHRIAFKLYVLTHLCDILRGYGIEIGTEVPTRFSRMPLDYQTAVYMPYTLSRCGVDCVVRVVTRRPKRRTSPRGVRKPIAVKKAAGRGKAGAKLSRALPVGKDPSGGMGASALVDRADRAYGGMLYPASYASAHEIYQYDVKIIAVCITLQNPTLQEEALGCFYDRGVDAVREADKYLLSREGQHAEHLFAWIVPEGADFAFPDSPPGQLELEQVMLPVRARNKRTGVGN